MTLRIRPPEAVASLVERQLELITLLDRAQVAKLFGISPWTVWARVRRDQMPKPVRITPSGKHYWRLSDLKRWLDKLQRVTPRCRPSNP